MDRRTIPAIDMHSHYNHGSRQDTRTSEIYRADLDYLKQMNQAANIAITFYSSFAAVLSPESVVEENEHAFALAQQLDWVYQWVVVDPRQEETIRQARQMLPDRKCIGIKIHPLSHGYSIFDHADRLFALAAEYQAVVLMHPETPAGMPALTDRYPTMKLIIAHLGSTGHVEAIRNSRWGNIYVDTSGEASKNNRIIEYAVEQAGSDHILFGTDTYAAAFQRGRIEYALIDEEAKLNILCRNAQSLFGDKLSQASEQSDQQPGGGRA